MAKVKATVVDGQALAEGIQEGQEGRGSVPRTPGTASVSVRGERVPLTPEGLANARATRAEVGRALADSARRSLGTD